ncbi:unnamed protein product [Tilletia controversa]|nr:unnamed protein product [Tilletia controversa]
MKLNDLRGISLEDLKAILLPQGYDLENGSYLQASIRFTRSGETIRVRAESGSMDRSTRRASRVAWIKDADDGLDDIGFFDVVAFALRLEDDSLLAVGRPLMLSETPHAVTNHWVCGRWASDLETIDATRIIDVMGAFEMSNSRIYLFPRKNEDRFVRPATVSGSRRLARPVFFSPSLPSCQSRVSASAFAFGQTSQCRLPPAIEPATIHPPGSPRSSSPDRASPIAAVFRLPRFSDEDLDAAPVRTSNEDGEDKDDSVDDSVRHDEAEEDNDSFRHDEAEEDNARPSDDDSSDLSSVPGDDCSDSELSEDGSLHDSDRGFEIGDSEEISEGSSEDEDEEASSSNGSSESSIDGDEELRRANKDPRGTWRPPRQKRKRTALYDSDSDSDDDKPVSALIKDKPLPLELKVPIAPLLEDKPLPLKNPSLKRKLARLDKGKTHYKAIPLKNPSLKRKLAHLAKGKAY